MKKIRKTNKILLAFALLLIAGAMAGNTLAFLLDASEDVTNTFDPGYVTTQVVETFKNDVKSDVAIRNTGNTDAYIRAAVLVTWQNDAGEVYGEKPTADDYSITWNVDTADDKNDDSKPWIKGADGFYYHKKSVAPNGTTEALILECKKLGNCADTNYDLCVEIIGSGIQAKGVYEDQDVVVKEWLDDAGNLELKNGKIAVKEVQGN